MDLKDSCPAYIRNNDYCIPYLQLNDLISHFDGLSSKFNTDRRLMLETESIINKLQEKTTLPDTFIILFLPVSPTIMNLNTYEWDIPPFDNLIYKYNHEIVMSLHQNLISRPYFLPLWIECTLQSL